jgi:SAM-dependent methyltransferase
MAKDKPQSKWWQSFYDDTPFHLYLERHDPVELEATLNFLTNVLQLGPGDRVFDQCCGMGSVSIPLAKRGYQMVGVDLCKGFIARANRDTEVGALPAEFFVGDAFTFVPGEPCDAAFNWYTSFGYSARDSENMRMLQRAFESLKPGSWFALDFPNAPLIRNNFQASMERRLETPEGEIIITRDCELDEDTGIMKQVWHWALPDGRKIDSESTLRLYTPGQLVRLFERAGFTNIKLYGNLEGDPRSDKSPRCICVGRRPG